MTLDADDKAWIRQLLEELLLGKKEVPVIPGSFLDRLNSAKRELSRKESK